MTQLSLTEAVIYALDHMPGELVGVFVSQGRAQVSLQDAGGVYVCNVQPCERERMKEVVRDRRARRWVERERKGTL